jgi:alcohol dehydrogenase
MKAIGLREYLPIENIDALQDVELEKPVASGRDILVAVSAVSVNPVDTKVRAPKPLLEKAPRVLGYDAVGTVVDVGDAVSLFKVGDKVFYAGDITRPGTNSEFHLVDERIVGFAPKSQSDEKIAAMPLTAITAYEALFDRMHISKTADNSQRSILIIGGAGGVGSVAIQLAKSLAGLRVVATASKESSRQWCMGLGADAVVNHYDALVPACAQLGFTEFDYILCLNNTDRHFPAMAELIKPQGAICTVVENEKPLDVHLLKSKSASFAWEFMFTRAMFQTDDMLEQHHLLNEIASLMDRGLIQSTLNTVLQPINAENLREAHRLLESGAMQGKLVVKDWS